MTNSATETVAIRAARRDETATISALAWRSKAHWGYSSEFMDACRAELTYTAEDILTSRTVCKVAVCDDVISGFYVLRQWQPEDFELEALFIAPEHIGTGLGRALMDDVSDTVASRGGGCIRVQSDPHAAPFYRALGASPTGARESGSIPGRSLPVFEMRISPRAPQSGK